MKKVIRYNKIECDPLDFVISGKNETLIGRLQSDSRISSDGFFEGEATLAREGVYLYADEETGEEWYELQPADEIENALTSFETRPVVIDHPPEWLNAENSQKYLQGATSNIYYKEGKLRGTVGLFTKEAINAYTTTHPELSCAYLCVIEEKKGTWVDKLGLMGEAGKSYLYKGIQRGIEGNHLALVEQARAGAIAKIDPPSSPERPIINSEQPPKIMDKTLQETKVQIVNGRNVFSIHGTDAQSVSDLIGDLTNQNQILEGKLNGLNIALVEAKKQIKLANSRETTGAQKIGNEAGKRVALFFSIYDYLTRQGRFPKAQRSRINMTDPYVKAIGEETGNMDPSSSPFYPTGNMDPEETANMDPEMMANMDMDPEMAGNMGDAHYPIGNMDPEMMANMAKYYNMEPEEIANMDPEMMANMQKEYMANMGMDDPEYLGNDGAALQDNPTYEPAFVTPTGSLPTPVENMAAIGITPMLSEKQMLIRVLNYVAPNVPRHNASLEALRATWITLKATSLNSMPRQRKPNNYLSRSRQWLQEQSVPQWNPNFSLDRQNARSPRDKQQIALEAQKKRIENNWKL